MVFRIMASCHLVLKRREREEAEQEKDIEKVRSKLRKKEEVVAGCQIVKQWNGMSSGGRKTQLSPSFSACQADSEKLTITQEEKQAPESGEDQSCCLRAAAGVTHCHNYSV